jgi:hypothetical protein
MKYIITESQFESVIPPAIKRRYQQLDDSVYEMLYNTSVGFAADDYTKEDYIDYVIEILFDEFFLEWAENAKREDIVHYFTVLTQMFAPRIGDFWDNKNEYLKL